MSEDVITWGVEGLERETKRGKGREEVNREGKVKRVHSEKRRVRKKMLLLFCLFVVVYLLGVGLR